ncbi:tyrosine-type recombinase/integrase [Shewanella sp. A25]|nr:tyrosine-type recombinase/integrase [Shewanella shenzhenensis]
MNPLPELDEILTPEKAKVLVRELRVKHIEVHGKALRAIFKKDRKLVKEKLNIALTLRNILALKDIVKKWKTLPELEIRKSAALFNKMDFNTNPIMHTFIEKFRKYYFDGLAPSTQVGYNAHLERIAEKFGNVNIDEIRADDVKDFKLALRAKFSGKTTNETIRLLKRLFDIAVEDNVINKVPFNHHHIKSSSNTKPPLTESDLFTKEDLFSIGNNISSNPPIALLILLNCCIGLRFSELMGLAWEDIDFNNRIIHVKRAIVNRQIKSLKVGSCNYRQVDILDPAYDLLIEMKNRFFHQSKLQTIQKLNSDNKTFQKERVRFVLQCTGTHNTNHFEQIFRRKTNQFLKDCQIKQKTPGHCRHTFASNLISAGAKIDYISIQLGHSSVKTTEKFYYIFISKLNKAGRDQASQALASFFPDISSLHAIAA